MLYEWENPACLRHVLIRKEGDHHQRIVGGIEFGCRCDQHHQIPLSIAPWCLCRLHGYVGLVGVIIDFKGRHYRHPARNRESEWLAIARAKIGLDLHGDICLVEPQVKLCV